MTTPDTPPAATPVPRPNPVATVAALAAQVREHTANANAAAVASPTGTVPATAPEVPFTGFVEEKVWRDNRGYRVLQRIPVWGAPPQHTLVGVDRVVIALPQAVWKAMGQHEWQETIEFPIHGNDVRAAFERYEAFRQPALAQLQARVSGLVAQFQSALAAMTGKVPTSVLAAPVAAVPTAVDSLSTPPVAPAVVAPAPHVGPRPAIAPHTPHAVHSTPAPVAAPPVGQSTPAAPVAAPVAAPRPVRLSGPVPHIPQPPRNLPKNHDTNRVPPGPTLPAAPTPPATPG